MSNTLGGIILIGLFLLAVGLRIPIMFAIGFSTTVTVLYLKIPVVMMVSSMVKGLNSFSLMAIPFFILTGEIMGAGGISDRLIKFSKALVGPLRGGLAHVNILASLFFGGISGSPVADVSSIGAILIPMMEKDGFDTEFATGVTMASSTEGLLIPPSHNMIIYAMAAGSVSVAKLFVAGVLPGVLVALVLMIYSAVVSVKRNYPKGDKFSARLLWSTFIDSFYGLLTIIIIMVGVLTGICTATEAAAMAVVWAVIVTFFIYRDISIKEMWGILGRSLRTLGTIMGLIGISSAFGWVLAYLKIPNAIMHGIMGLTTNKILILILMNLILLVLGMIMDMSSIILIATPILLPIAKAIGMDPIQFGVMLILNLGIGLITPPVGSVLFVCSGISKLSIEKLTRAMGPFYLVMGVALICVTYVPWFSMWLPSLIHSVGV